jgi:hypothetical protein
MSSAAAMAKDLGAQVATLAVFWARPPLRPDPHDGLHCERRVGRAAALPGDGKAQLSGVGTADVRLVTRCLAGRNGLYYDALDSLGNVSKHSGRTTRAR